MNLKPCLIPLFETKISRNSHRQTKASRKLYLLERVYLMFNYWKIFSARHITGYLTLLRLIRITANMVKLVGVDFSLL